MQKYEFRYKSCDGVTQIHGMEWVPDGEIKGVLQICHGMIEHIGRYDEFARYLNEKGYVVLGNDHLGHGKSVRTEDDYGYFSERKGNQVVLGDIHKLRKWGQNRYQNIPYYILGHSMGSFLVRQYLTIHSSGLDGAIIMGTGYHFKAELIFGQKLCEAIAAVRGWKFRSKLINRMGFEGFNRRFEPATTKKDWLSSDVEKCYEYLNDPYCNFIFTVNGYYCMFESMKELNKKRVISRTDKELPILFVSGVDDPVGNFGKGVEKVYHNYVKAGFKKTELVLYKDKRHEVLNELNRDKVYEDLYLWLESH